MRLTDPVARYADEGAQCAPGAAPEGGHTGLAAEAGDCPHFEGRGLRLELQGHGRRRPQGDPDYLKYGAHNEAAISKAERVSRPGAGFTCGAAKFRACWAVWDQHPDHAAGRDEGRQAAKKVWAANCCAKSGRSSF